MASIIGRILNYLFNLKRTDYFSTEIEIDENFADNHIASFGEVNTNITLSDIKPMCKLDHDSDI